MKYLSNNYAESVWIRVTFDIWQHHQWLCMAIIHLLINISFVVDDEDDDDDDDDVDWWVAD